MNGGATMTDMVCAWCDVYARVPCEARDDRGNLVTGWTKCAYCGRTELGRRRGRSAVGVVGVVDGGRSG
jgi:hypothetical protein